MNGKPIYNVGSNYLYNAGSAWVICSEYHKNNCASTGWFYSSGACDWPTDDGCEWWANTGTDGGDGTDECQGRPSCKQCGAWWQ